jgi:hypothetical protein
LAVRRKQSSPRGPPVAASPVVAAKGCSPRQTGKLLRIDLEQFFLSGEEFVAEFIGFHCLLCASKKRSRSLRQARRRQLRGRAIRHQGKIELLIN